MSCDSPLCAERRRSSRIVAIPNETRLEWTAPGRRQTSRGTVLNVSQSGALVATDAVPEMRGPLLIRLRKPVRPTGALRLAFASPRGIVWASSSPEQRRTTSSWAQPWESTWAGSSPTCPRKIGSR